MVFIKKEVSNLIRSGILFPDRTESEKFMGMTLKSWLNLQKEDKIFEVYEKLNLKIKEDFSISIKNAVTGLIKASKAYTNKKLWGDKRKQSKQRLALKLFFKLVFQDYHHIYQTLSPDVVFNEKEKSIEEQLLIELDPKFISALWFVLIGYEVISPFIENSRPRNNHNEGAIDLINYISLLDDIMKYWPVVGSLSSFHEIEIFKNKIESARATNAFVTPLTLIDQLQTLCDLVEIRTSPENLTISNDHANVLIPEGIWTDSHDSGKSRFWIFPLNLRMIFCYSFEYGKWHLKVFEAISDYDEENEEYVLSVISPEESKKALIRGTLSPESIHEMRARYSNGNQEYVEKLEFTHMNERPTWFNFSCMFRLTKESELHKRFSAIINELYQAKPFRLDSPLINSSVWMTDASNSLIAMDEKYIYLKEKNIVRHILRKAENLDGEYYQYGPVPGKEKEFALLGIDISEESPLYIISRTEADYPEIEPKDEIKKMIFSNIDIENSDEQEQPDYANLLRREAEIYRRFKEAVFSTSFPGEITIYTLHEGNKKYKKICFNKCGVAVDLEKAISLYGVKEITSFAQVFPSVSSCLP